MTMERAELLAAAQAKWRSSGLQDAHAKRLRLEALTAKQVQALGPTFQPAGALRLPYFDPSGKPTDFYRVRYLEPLPGFAGVVKKPQRYAQPPKTLNEVYLPPLLPKPWKDVLQDSETPLYITEGELKAAAGCIAGLATLGLGGVDVWRSSKRGMDLLPVLQKTVWENRTVVIVYDSDAATNPNVVRAQRQLAQELLNRGALPAIASLPASPEGHKQGLDDYLVANGADALRALCQDSPAFPEAEALWEMNEEVVYVRDPGLVIARNSGQKLSPSNFTQHAYANRHYTQIIVSKTGEQRAEQKSLAKRWLEWERRFELSRVTYAPGKGQVTDKGEWNQWRGWGVEPKKGDVAPWKWLLSYLFASEPNPAVRQWFERWCAYPLQHPGTKLFTCAALWGIQHGTGKTLVGHSLMRIYGDNSVEIKDEDLKGGFTEWAENKQFVAGDEVTGSDRREYADRLKGLITQPFFRINVKYIPSYTVEDCVNYYFTSNHPDAFFLEDSDRRFFIHEVVGAPAARKHYTDYDRWYKSPEGAAALFHYLLNLDLGDFDPRAPAIVTESKKAMIVDNKSDIGLWCSQLRDDPSTMLRPLGERIAGNCALLSSAQLLRAYDPQGAGRAGSNGLARELKRAGFRQCRGGAPIRTSAGLLRLYAVRDADRWCSAKAAECVAHWEEFFGPQSKKY